jgi:hypothetical protein
VRVISDRFAASVRQSHLVATRCELYFPEDPTTAIVVPLEDGDVTSDRTALIRTTANVRIPWSLRIGADLGLDLRTLPLGGYCLLYRGLRYADRSEELLRLGVFRVESVTWRTSDDSAQLELADRMAQVRDEPFLAPYQPAATIGATKTGTLTDESPVVALAPDTSGLLVGMTVAGVGIPAGRRIQTIGPGAQVTLNAPVNVSGLKDGRVQQGDPVITNIVETADLTAGMVLGPFGTSDIVPGSILAAVESEHSVRMDRGAAGSGDTGVTYQVPNPQTLTFGGGVRVADAAIAIVQGVFPTAPALKLYDPAAVLVDSTFSRNRAEALQVLALAVGGEQFFNADGIYVFGLPAGSGSPVWALDAGEAGVMVGADESLNRTGVYNGVLVEGQNAATDPPVAALVIDSDPASPTRWGGPFGKVARVEQSSAVQTVEQAQAAAQALLDKRLQLTRSLTVTSAVNPALEAGDVVAVTFPDGRQETHLVDAVRTGIAASGSQAFTLRSVDAPTAQRRLTPGPRRVFHNAAAWREVRDARPAVSV